MKYAFLNNRIVATAESDIENIALLSAGSHAEQITGVPMLGSVEKPKIKHRKHRFLKQCPECGTLKKSVRGHMSFAHPAAYMKHYPEGSTSGRPITMETPRIPHGPRYPQVLSRVA